jgi:hypothetical protein
MSNKNAVDLYELLPALYRLRDAERGYPLREVLGIISTQADIIKQDIDGLWDDLFIETCNDWVVPYIGDLVGNNPLHEVAARHRTDVAKTIYYRRRKATLPMLEELARDVTGWYCHAVAFFELLGWTQNLNHLRYQTAPTHDDRDPRVFDRVGTVNLRNIDALDRLNGPFDVISHTVDVRPIGRTEGWYNIPKIGFFLWRLRHYPLSDITPRKASVPHDYGYHFSTLGYPAPLFNNPEREADPTGLASEIHLPGPIRPVAFHFGPGDYYGSDRSFSIVKDGAEIPLASIMCKDLRDWDRPPAGVTGVLSGDLSSFTTLSSTAPAVNVKIGAEGPHTASFSAVPADLAEARSLLEDAIHDAHTSLAFTGARVVVVDDRLLVLPGITGAPVNFEATAADSATIMELALDSIVEQLRGVLSGDLSSFPKLNSPAPTVDVTIGGEGPHVAPLGPRPADLAEARSLLEDAIHDAHTSLAFTGARVVVVDDRLLVLPGTTDEITIGPSETDAITVEQLALSNKVAIDVDLGRFTFAVGDEPKNGVTVSYGYGFSADIGGGPYDRRQTLADPGQAVWEKTVDQQDPNADFQNLNAALAAWANPADGNKASATITITDNGPYTQEIAIEPANRGHLVIQAEDGKRPTLRFVDAQGDLANLVISGASGSGADLTLNGLLIEGGIYVERDSLGQLRIVNCTLVPGRELNVKGGPREPDRPSVVVESPNSRLGVEIDHSIVGALRLPAENVDLAVRDSIVDSPTRDRPARRIPAIAESDGGNRPGPPATLERTTVFGAVHLKELIWASEIAFTDPIVIQRRQAGCVRFSHVPRYSQTPRRYRCQPDLALEGVSDPARQDSIRARLTPSFTSVQYGHPAYAQLGLTCAEEISAGAESGSEMGAFSSLKQPQREANLRVRIDEYLPFGLEAGIIYAT